MGSEQIRFPQQQQQERSKRWGGCWGAFSCFGSQKGCKRIVPASRIPEGSASTAQQNGAQANLTTTLHPSLMAPPSSPASFTNSALPSTAQSPSCFLSLSANSPGGPSSTMFATGPYAHETQLVSPPVFSTYTTEPSTAPLTPPPELAHLTTPSSPDVPYARFLSSSRDFRGSGKSNYIAANDLQASYALYPESPASSLRSPISRMSSGCLSSPYPEREFPSQWDPSASPQTNKNSGSGSSRLYGHENNTAPMVSHDTNFFCPATFAEFYLDHNSVGGGRLSVSKDSDTYCNGSNSYQNRQTNRSPMQDAEEIEAYRASFGFSADEIITTPQYVEITDVMDDSFTMPSLASNNLAGVNTSQFLSTNEQQRADGVQASSQNGLGVELNHHSSKNKYLEMPASHDRHEGLDLRKQQRNVPGSSMPAWKNLTDVEDNTLPKLRTSRSCRKSHAGLSSSDAEIEYRRGRSLREGRGHFAWRG